MPQIVKNGESIEGKKIKGSSRKPVSYKGIVLEKGKKLHKFISQFNTKSSIIETISEKERLFETANISINDEIFCDDALLRSVDKHFSTEHESNASSTHGASVWSFPKHTNVMITRSHQEIENAIYKRELACKSYIQLK